MACSLLITTILTPEGYGVNLFNNPVIVGLTKQLDAASLTQKVIANNVANVNTPGFKKSNVSFQDELRRALDTGAPSLITTNPRHMGGKADVDQVSPKVVQESGTTMLYGQNNVDIDQEMVNLAANSIIYDFSATSLSERLGLLSYVVKGGK